MTQLSFLDDPPTTATPAAPARARRTDPVECHEAVAKINATVEASGQDKNRPSKELAAVFFKAMRACQPATARCLEAWITNIPNKFEQRFSVERIRAAKCWAARCGYIAKVGKSDAGGVWELTEKGRELAR